MFYKIYFGNQNRKIKNQLDKIEQTQTKSNKTGSNLNQTQTKSEPNSN